MRGIKRVIDIGRFVFDISIAFKFWDVYIKSATTSPDGQLMVTGSCYFNSKTQINACPNIFKHG